MARTSVTTRVERRRLPLVVALATALGLATASPAASATTRLVGRCGDMVGKGGDTLRVAISKAVSGDIVDLTPLPLTCTTITLTGGEIPIAVDSLIISSPRQITVDGNNAGRIFNHSATGILSIQYLTLTHGNAGASDGGCIFSAGEVSLSHSTITACQTSGSGGGMRAQSCFVGYSAIDANLASIGAGLSCAVGAMFVHSSVSGNLLGGGVSAGAVEAYYSTFANNATHLAGGGIASFGAGGVKLVNSTVSGNSTTVESPYYDAGGAWSVGDMTVQGSIISGNTSAVNAGGLKSNGNMTLTDSTVSGNHASGDNGGLTANSVTMIRSTIDSNTAAFGAGGGSATSAIISNSTISGNTAPIAAGFAASTLQISNSTVAFNVATGATSSSVGGIYGSNVTMASTIVADNTTNGSGPADVLIQGAAAFQPGSSLIVSCNRTTLSIQEDPKLTPLALHGGTVRTHALSTGSPAIDTGTSGGLPTDERGSGYPRVVGAAADIGAYERQATDDELFYSGFD
jgi:hypothetical protein